MTKEKEIERWLKEQLRAEWQTIFDETTMLTIETIKARLKIA